MDFSNAYDIFRSVRGERCEKCHRKGGSAGNGLQKCKDCEYAYYCSTKCQEEDYNTHVASGQASHLELCWLLNQDRFLKLDLRPKRTLVVLETYLRMFLTAIKFGRGPTNWNLRFSLRKSIL